MRLSGLILALEDYDKAVNSFLRFFIEPRMIRKLRRFLSSGQDDMYELYLCCEGRVHPYINERSSSNEKAFYAVYKAFDKTLSAPSCYSVISTLDLLYNNQLLTRECFDLIIEGVREFDLYRLFQYMENLDSLDMRTIELVFKHKNFKSNIGVCTQLFFIKYSNNMTIHENHILLALNFSAPEVLIDFECSSSLFSSILTHKPEPAAYVRALSIFEENNVSDKRYEYMLHYHLNPESLAKGLCLISKARIDLGKFKFIYYDFLEDAGKFHLYYFSTKQMEAFKKILANPESYPVKTNCTNNLIAKVKSLSDDYRLVEFTDEELVLIRETLTLMPDNAYVDDIEYLLPKNSEFTAEICCALYELELLTKSNYKALKNHPECDKAALDEMKKLKSNRYSRQEFMDQDHFDELIKHENLIDYLIALATLNKLFYDYSPSSHSIYAVIRSDKPMSCVKVVPFLEQTLFDPEYFGIKFNEMVNHAYPELIVKAFGLLQRGRCLSRCNLQIILNHQKTETMLNGLVSLNENEQLNQSTITQLFAEELTLEPVFLSERLAFYEESGFYEELRDGDSISKFLIKFAEDPVLFKMHLLDIAKIPGLLGSLGFAKGERHGGFIRDLLIALEMKSELFEFCLSKLTDVPDLFESLGFQEGQNDGYWVGSVLSDLVSNIALFKLLLSKICGARGLLESLGVSKGEEEGGYIINLLTDLSRHPELFELCFLKIITYGLIDNLSSHGVYNLSLELSSHPNLLVGDGCHAINLVLCAVFFSPTIMSSSFSLQDLKSTLVDAELKLFILALLNYITENELKFNSETRDDYLCFLSGFCKNYKGVIPSLFFKSIDLYLSPYIKDLKHETLYNIQTKLYVKGINSPASLQVLATKYVTKEALKIHPTALRYCNAALFQSFNVINEKHEKETLCNLN